MSTTIRWLSESRLRENAEDAKDAYWSFEEDLSVGGGWVVINEKHLEVYSLELGDLIIRIGPEILRLFDLILFNPRREQSFTDVAGLKEEIMRIQKRKEEKKTTFADYVAAISMAFPHYPLTKMGVKIRPLERFVVPFEAEKILRNGKEIDWFFWWENGYNALRHRVTEEFSTSATLKHVLFSLAGLWILHNVRDYDGIMISVFGKSDFFDNPFSYVDVEPKVERLR